MATATGGAFGNFVAKSPILQANRLAGQYQEAGMFDPFGSPRLRALRRKRALGVNDALRRRMSTRGRLTGLDPMAQRQAMIDQELRGNEELAGGLNQAEYEDSQSNLQFGRGLYMGNLDYARQMALEKQRAKAANAGAAGQAVGAIGGALIGKLPGLARGGTVFGPTQALIGEGGEPEAVVPQSHPGFGMLRRRGMLPRPFLGGNAQMQPERGGFAPQLPRAFRRFAGGGAPQSRPGFGGMLRPGRFGIAGGAF